jgi:hypothetical protein
MSFLNQTYAVPGRVLGVFRTMLALNRPVAEDELARLMAPAALQKEAESGQDMVTATARECVKCGLLNAQKKDGSLSLAAKVKKEALSFESVDRYLAYMLPQLVLDAENEVNHDLALALAWFLAQDPYHAPGNWSEAQSFLRDQLGEGELRKATGLTNSDPYNLLEYWAGYLGFAWTLSRRDREVNLPDPTAYLREHLDELLVGKDGEWQSLAGVMVRLAKSCPVFEGGVFRDRVETSLQGTPLARLTSQLSGATALAWYRLRDEDVVELKADADAPDQLLLPDGRGVSRPFALVRRKRSTRRLQS